MSVPVCTSVTCDHLRNLRIPVCQDRQEEFERICLRWYCTLGRHLVWDGLCPHRCLSYPPPPGGGEVSSFLQLEKKMLTRLGGPIKRPWPRLLGKLSPESCRYVGNFGKRGAGGRRAVVESLQLSQRAVEGPPGVRVVGHRPLGGGGGQTSHKHRASPTAHPSTKHDRWGGGRRNQEKMRKGET